MDRTLYWIGQLRKFRLAKSDHLAVTNRSKIRALCLSIEVHEAPRRHEACGEVCRVLNTYDFLNPELANISSEHKTETERFLHGFGASRNPFLRSCMSRDYPLFGEGVPRVSPPQARVHGAQHRVRRWTKSPPFKLFKGYFRAIFEPFSHKSSNKICETRPIEPGKARR